MRPSWNEVRVRAAQFAVDWKDSSYERGEAQTFYNEFFEIFGVKRRKVATFEEPVKKLGDRRGRIDLFWKGMLLVEAKSAGENLAKAKDQAFEYFPGIKDYELPRYVLVCDFQRFELFDLEENDHPPTRFDLAELPGHVESFGFIMGVQKRHFRDQDPVNIDAAELMGRLHDVLEESGYIGHNLERLLVRLLFCLFADATGIFERGQFLDLLAERTHEDGSDTGRLLTELFEVLNTPKENRQRALDEDLKAFEYINGDLFEERLPPAAFDHAMRDLLIEACGFYWDAVSPAIFGSLFQSVMNREERRKSGAHYTSERNILKVIEPLFMDDLRAEFVRLRERRDTARAGALRAFQEKLGSLKFLDPACGCGNFLIIAYRELRLLEIEVLRAILDERGPRMTGESRLEQLLQTTAARSLSVIDVDQFYGIEKDEFPARIAEVAMWMMDHIMNNRLSLEFSRVYSRIPLKKSPHVVSGNALDLDWSEVLPYEACSFILGNPPFVGHQWRSAEQQRDMARVWGVAGQFNRLDYVTCWFKKSLEYASHNTRIRIGFVSTNSITQGEQAGILWPVIFSQGIAIAFAHRTFQWNSEARGKAAVHCVIIGLAFNVPADRFIYEYDHIRGEPHVSQVRAINGYLINGPQYAVPARSRPRSGFLKMHKGSQPTDGARIKRPGGGYITYSNLILDNVDRAELLAKEPAVEKWLRPFVGGDELISGEWRWCLWLKDADPAEIRHSGALRERLERVRLGRLQSPTPSVKAFASFPTLFTQDRQPDQRYLAIPEVSSESREYIPIAFLEPEVIASNKLQIIPGAPMYYFGILTSAMHMAWMRTVGGRLKSDYSYAPAIYNSFPWPEMDASAKRLITELSDEVIRIRATFDGRSLDILYDFDAMPPALRRAHLAIDREVDELYQRKRFRFERERVEHLFKLFERELTAELDLGDETQRSKPKRRKKSK